MSAQNDDATAPKSLQPDIYVGTAGYNYSHWRCGAFYPRGLPHSSELRHYSGTFPAGEINATFHGVPREETLRSWAQDAKPGFRFGLKVPREITHERRLVGVGHCGTWRTFLERATGCLGDGSLGPVLFQLPPSLPKDLPRLEAVAGAVPGGLKVAFEFRCASWYCPEVYDALRRHGFAICENISPDGSAIRTREVTADWCYARFHKNGDRDVTDYTDEQLEKEADQIVERHRRGLVQYAFFLNDHEANGPKNAQTLMKFVKERLDTLGKLDISTTLVAGWKADPVIEKGGKGSIESMFANSRAKSAPKTSSQFSTSIKRKGGINQFLTVTKRQKTTTNVSKSSDGKSGTILNFFGKKK